jgi:hypothetical protein
MITDQGKVSSDAIGGVYDRAMTGIGQGYDAAQRSWRYQGYLML